MYQVLGQSFGGFCLLTYLSMAPEAIEAGIFTGGLPPLGRTPEEVYQGRWWLVGGEGEIKASFDAPSTEGRRRREAVCPPRRYTASLTHRFS